MRIALGTQNFFQLNNGQAVFTDHLARGLANQGHDVMVLTPSEHDHAHSERRDGVRIEAITAQPLRPWYPDVYVTFRPTREVARLIDGFEPDIVHIQDHFPLCRSVARVAHSRRLPLVGTNHFLPENIMPFVPVLSRSRWARAQMERLLWRMVLQVFAGVTAAAAPSRTAASLLCRQGLQRPVYVLSNGVDLDRFHPDRTVDRVGLRLRYGLDPTRVVLLFVGRVDREKRLDVLIRAMHLLQRSDVQLAIAGRGRDGEALRALTQQLALEEGRVVFVGFVPEEDLPALLNSADIFAMPSEAELQSIATLEAMATGLPVLAADAHALPELVENGANGYLFSAGDVADAALRLEQLLQEQMRWQEIGLASRKKAGAHSLVRTIEGYSCLYCEVLAARTDARLTTA